MILIAESGSTNTDWVAYNGQVYRFTSSGINPLFLDAEELKIDLNTHFPAQLKVDEVQNIYFYGPGCSSAERCNKVSSCLSMVFSNAKIEAHSDLLAAARALFSEQKGIACILGTGANSGIFDGQQFSYQIPSTGFILGDEGSGAHIGLSVLKLYLKQQLPPILHESFKAFIGLTITEIIDRVYRQAYPNRFLASISPWIFENRNEPMVQEILMSSFDTFFKYYVLPYKHEQDLPIGMVGSVAHFFAEEIKASADKYQLKIEKIIQKPIEQLAKFHINF
ncbi:MAG: ATPase [Bacteroidales bacterium]|nr:ATPase [Bacteroidales bacterium]